MFTQKLFTSMSCVLTLVFSLSSLAASGPSIHCIDHFKVPEYQLTDIDIDSGTAILAERTCRNSRNPDCDFKIAPVSVSLSKTYEDNSLGFKQTGPFLRVETSSPNHYITNFSIDLCETVQYPARPSSDKGDLSGDARGLDPELPGPSAQCNLSDIDAFNASRGIKCPKSARIIVEY